MKGSCLCKKVKYEITRFHPHLTHCHCSMCRKFHGAAFATYGSVKVEDFKLTHGGEDIKVYRSSDLAERGFCPDCGSSIYFKFLNQSTTIDIALGTLDEEPDLAVAGHIFYGSKPLWSGDFNDTLPKFSEEHNLNKT